MKEELKKTLEIWGEDVIVQMIQVLQSRNKLATKTLARAIEFRLGPDFIEFFVNPPADQYAKYVESGTRAHGISFKKYPEAKKSLIAWANAKGLSQKANQYSRSNYGFVRKQAPVGFWATVLEKEVQKLALSLEDDIVKYMQERIEFINKT